MLRIDCFKAMAELADASKDEVLGKHPVNEDFLTGSLEELENVGQVLMEGSFDCIIGLEV